MTAALPPARVDGLASAFVGGNAVWPLCIAAVVVAAVIDVAAVAGVLAGAALVAGIARRRIGGYTGDVLGAAGVVGETVGLLVMAAR